MDLEDSGWAWLGCLSKFVHRFATPRASCSSVLRNIVSAICFARQCGHNLCLVTMCATRHLYIGATRHLCSRYHHPESALDVGSQHFVLPETQQLLYRMHSHGGEAGGRQASYACQASRVLHVVQERARRTCVAYSYAYACPVAWIRSTCTESIPTRSQRTQYTCREKFSLRSLSYNKRTLAPVKASRGLARAQLRSCAGARVPRFLSGNCSRVQRHNDDGTKFSAIWVVGNKAAFMSIA